MCNPGHGSRTKSTPWSYYAEPWLDVGIGNTPFHRIMSVINVELDLYIPLVLGKEKIGKSHTRNKYAHLSFLLSWVFCGTWNRILKFSLSRSLIPFKEKQRNNGRYNEVQ